MPEKPIWEKIADIVEQFPLEVWGQVPTDGAVQHDHYLYGAHKKDETTATWAQLKDAETTNAWLSAQKSNS